MAQPLALRPNPYQALALRPNPYQPLALRPKPEPCGTPVCLPQQREECTEHDTMAVTMTMMMTVTMVLGGGGFT